MMMGQGDVARGAAILLAALHVYKFYSMAAAEELELQQSARLLRAELKWLFRARLVLLIAVAAIPLLPVAVLAEGIGRYLFFVSVVSRNMATTFFGTAREAA
jgi:hypothetical protein